MQIEEEIENLKNDGNDQKYVEIKKQKIKTLEGKLNKIRECALFLGDMSEMHKKTISKAKVVTYRYRGSKTESG